MAKKKGWLFDLDFDWLFERVESGTCELSGLKFDLGLARVGKNNSYAPSIYRIVAGGDYTKENCRVVLHALNTALSDWGEDIYFDVAAAYMERVRGQAT
ncbi:hypothetical protein LCGC14_0373400 [marine sediment metagenome]|uniref:Uncharacterized protein n=1 Tax=marine sediment metagenome TaxID=412755 RepID=A0A0F9T4I8_9ZZZZ